MESKDQLVIKIEIDVANNPDPPSSASQHHCDCESGKMPLKTFLVVEFTDEATVDVIHSRWITETTDSDLLKGKCYWPPGSNQERLAKAGQVPDCSTWSLHPVRIMYSTDDYLLARRRAAEAQFTSDLDSEDEPEGAVRKRKRKQVLNYLEAQFTSDLDSEDEPEGAVRKRKRKSVQYSSDESSDNKPILKSKLVSLTVERPQTSQTPAERPQTSQTSAERPQTSQTSAERPQTSQTPAERSQTSSSLTSVPAAPPTPTRSFGVSLKLEDPDDPLVFPTSLRSPASSNSRHQNEEVLQSQILKELAELKGLVKDLQCQVTSTMTLLLKKKDVDECSAELPEDLRLPLQTVADVEALESLDDSKQETLIKSLSTIGGSNPKDFIKRMMKQLMTDPLASGYNWKGKNDKKIPFSKLMLLSIVKRAVRRNPRTSNAGDCDIEAPIKEWLRFAPERERRRKEKEQRERTQAVKQK